VDATAPNLTDWTPLAPGLRQTGCSIVLDIPELLGGMDLEDTEAHREAVSLAARVVVTGLQLYARQVVLASPAAGEGVAPWSGAEKKDQPARKRAER
jgi:hypothetical protein